MIHSSPSSPISSGETSFWEGLFLESRSPPSAEDNLLDYLDVHDEEHEERTIFRSVDRHMFSQTIPDALGYGVGGCSPQDYYCAGPRWFSPPRREAFPPVVMPERETADIYYYTSSGKDNYSVEACTIAQKKVQHQNDGMIPMDSSGRDSQSINNPRLDFMYTEDDEELSCSSEKSFLPITMKTDLLLEELLPSSSMDKSLEPENQDNDMGNTEWKEDHGVTTTTQNGRESNDGCISDKHNEHRNGLQMPPAVNSFKPAGMLSQTRPISQRSSCMMSDVDWYNQIAPKKNTALYPQSLVQHMMAGFAIMPSLRMTTVEESGLLPIQTQRTPLPGTALKQSSSRRTPKLPVNDFQATLMPSEDRPCFPRPRSYQTAVSTAIITTPMEFDILLGRGHGVNRHPGNTRFRSFIVQYRDLYRSSTVCEKKTAITQLLVGMCKAPFLHKGGWVVPRFLRFQKELDGWEEVSDEVARQKISHLLRLRANNNSATSSNISRSSSGRGH